MACTCERGGSDGGIAGWASKLTEEWVASIWWGEITLGMVVVRES